MPRFIFDRWLFRVGACQAKVTRRLKVTETSLLESNAAVLAVSSANMDKETTNSMLVRVSRFFSDRYAYRTQPGYFSELVAFGIVVFVAAWPITLVAHAMALAPK